MSRVHSTAYIDPKAKIGSDIDVGAYSIVHGNVTIGDRAKIGSYCEIGISTHLGDGSALCIGDDANIRSHSIFYESSRIGNNLVTGHYVVVRENTVAGDGFQVGTSSEIQGDCQVGDYVRFQSNVFVGKKTTIGNYVWVLPYVIFTNDPTPPSNELIGCVIEDFASIAAASVILPGVVVGKHSLVAASACVSKDVPPGMVVAGVPARVVSEANTILKRDGSGDPAYPWISHFHRGYPDVLIEEWMKNLEESKGEE